MKILQLAQPLCRVAIVLGFLVPAVTLPAASPPLPTLDQIESLAEEAYVFAVPLLEFYKTMYRDSLDESASTFRGRLNHVWHNRDLAGPEARRVVRPNNDNLYSRAWLDLRDGPVVLTVPPIPAGRYWSLQFADVYTHNFALVGQRTHGNAGGRFLVAPAGWSGPNPSNVTAVLRCESTFAISIFRFGVDARSDIPAVNALQDRLELHPLGRASSHAKVPRTNPEAEYPRYNAAEARAEHFIRYVNFLLGHVSIHPSEIDLLARFFVLGIGPGRMFDPATLDPSRRAALRRGIDRALQILQTSDSVRRQPRGAWGVGDCFGDRARMQNRYLVRASAALFGLFGLDREEAVYFGTTKDADGLLLDGARHAYTLHFPADQVPRVQAFWSLTMYDRDGFMVPNPGNRYSIGDRTDGLRYGPDRSLTVYLQPDSPGPERELNWLPTPAGPFNLVLRNYLPNPGTEQSYIPPAVTRTR